MLSDFLYIPAYKLKYNIKPMITQTDDKPKTKTVTHHAEGKNGKWTTKALNAITESWKGDYVGDGEGLSGQIRVAANGELYIHFKYVFRCKDNITGKDKTAFYYCGDYTKNKLNLAEIREERNRARELCKIGIDPREHKKAKEIEEKNSINKTIIDDEKAKLDSKTFSDLFSAWLKNGVARKNDNQYLKLSFRKHAIPIIGSIEIRKIHEDQLLDLYRSVIQEKGLITTGIELSKDIRQMLEWGSKHKLWRKLFEDGNPADLLNTKKITKLLVPSDYQKERERVLNPREIATLNKMFIDAKTNNKHLIKEQSQIALWICLSTLCRIGELMKTEWANIDLNRGLWTVPKIDTKGDVQTHHVFLSDFTIRKFQELKIISGHTPYAFPSKPINNSDKVNHLDEKTITKQVGDRQIQFKNRTKPAMNRVQNNDLVLGEEEWTPHDLRRAGATMMQLLDIDNEIIDRCQNHLVLSQVQGHYLMSKKYAEQIDAWEALGSRIEEILNTTDIDSLPNYINDFDNILASRKLRET